MPSASLLQVHDALDAPSPRAIATVDAGGDHFPVYAESEAVPLSWTWDALLPLVLLPAMTRGLDIRADGISPKLAEALPTIQDIYQSWGPDLHRVAVAGGTSEAPPRARTKRVGTFFSGGADSFYTLLKHQAEITDIIFVHGFDIKLDDAPLRAQAAATAQEVGQVLGKRVIEIETNIRTLLDPHQRWGPFSHGPALVTMAHLLREHLDRVYIPATHTYRDLLPWGSHPILDHRWTTETTEIVHDGCEARRVDKVALLARSDVALRTLRVCYMNPGGAYNCGRCEKCVRTMVNLTVAGALERCTTFDTPLDLKRVARTRPRDANERSFIEENLDALQRRGHAPELQAALARALAPKSTSAPAPPPTLSHRVRSKLRRVPGVQQLARAIRGR